MKTIVIKVTKNDIAKGKRREATSCPIALALHRAGFQEAEVGFLYWFPDSSWRGIKLSEAAIRFIRAFDDKEAVKPFNFRLKVP